MKKDHYSVLGVTPASEDVVIRAAYRALMRRYHPDADPSAEAAERAREINEAYRVLSEPGPRARYDDGLKQQSPLKFDPEFRPGPPEPKRLRIAPLAAIGFAAVAAGMVAFAVSPSVREFVELPSSEVEEEAPKTQASILPAKSTTKAPTDHCADPSAADLVKAELFRRAADLRPVERARLERVAQLAQLRIDASKAAANGCSGWLAVDFPPGLVVDGSRSNLNADIGFRLAQSEQGLRLASLSRVDGVVRSIVTLGPPPREPEAIRPPDTKEIAAVEPSKRPSRKSTALPAATTSNAARTPSPDQSRSACASAASRSERIICASDNLSSLDRQLALLYRQSWKEADEKKRAALIGTRQRFNDRREACGSSNCMTTAYVTRLREIRRDHGWQGPAVGTHVPGSG